MFEKRGLVRRIVRAVAVFAVVFAFVVAFSNCKRVYNGGSYFIDVKFDGQRLVGNVCYTVGEGESGCAFAFYPAVLCSKSEIENVRVNDERSSFEVNSNGLVSILCSVRSGDRIAFDYYLEPDNSNERLGVTDKTVNFALFYPIKIPQVGGKPVYHEYTDIGDPFFFDFCDYEMVLSLPSVYSVACGMKPVECNVNGEFTEYRFMEKKVRNLAFSISEYFNVVSKKSGYKSINYYFYDDAQPENTLKNACDAVALFSDIIGEYPYDNLCFAQSPFSYGGMEYSGFFVVGKDDNYDNYITAVVHETAHQWFPMAVGSDEYVRPCFDEGVAEFLTRKYFDMVDSDKAQRLRDVAEKGYEGYLLNCKNLGKEPLEQGNHPLCEFSSLYEYTVNAYYISSRSFERCQEILGKSFDKAISKFYCNYKFTNASAENFFDCFSLVKRSKAKNMLKNYV